MNVVKTDLPGVLILEPDVFRDPRGFFAETYHKTKYAALGIDATFVQDNHSRSTKRTLRGLHAQGTYAQAKLIRVLAGTVLDVVVDIRPGSATYKKWVAVELSAENFRQCFIPVGFAHGFYTLSEVAEVEYKCSDVYHPDDELRLRWNDPEVGIRWPESDPILSAKDQTGLFLRELEPRLRTLWGTSPKQ
jgi:dTDP-4-dehydrorhamnose 3,5-epimerase